MAPVPAALGAASAALGAASSASVPISPMLSVPGENSFSAVEAADPASDRAPRAASLIGTFLPLASFSPMGVGRYTTLLRPSSSSLSTRSASLSLSRWADTVDFESPSSSPSDVTVAWVWWGVSFSILTRVWEDTALSPVKSSSMWLFAALAPFGYCSFVRLPANIWEGLKTETVLLLMWRSRTLCRAGTC